MAYRWIAAFAFALAVPGMAVAAVPASNLLTASAPANDAAGKDPVSAVELTFAQPVDLLSVTLILPGKSEQELLQVGYDRGAPKQSGKSFCFPLAAPLTQPGAYKISYLLKTRGIPSLNGFVDFTIEPKFPAPRVAWVAPSADSEEAGPVTEVGIALDSAVDLQRFELARADPSGDDTLATVIEAFVGPGAADATPESGTEFSFKLATPLAAKGDYTVTYAYSVTNPDGSVSNFSKKSAFSIQ